MKEITRLQNEEQERQWNRKQKEYELETERQKKKNRLECVEMRKELEKKAFELQKTTYVNMLGSETLENHVPAFNRKWLKERILTDLPHLKSIRQKDRRKSAVIYSPEACDEEMVRGVM